MNGDTLKNAETLWYEIDLYESLALISERMFKAAAQKDWDEFFTQEQYHQEIDARLRAPAADNKALGPNDLKRKEGLIDQIISTDKKTQGLLQERMTVLQQGIGDEMKVTQTYGSQTT